MPDPIHSPIELGFSEFVSKLISDTFEAVVSTGISQEEDWIQLNEMLSLDISEFTRLVIDPGMVNSELVRLFPDNKGGTVIMKECNYRAANSEKGITEDPPIALLTGYQPKGKKLSAADVSAINTAVMENLGRKQYDVLSRVLSRGATRVIVDAGRINAKLNFAIVQVDEGATASGSAPSGGTHTADRLYIKRKFPGFTELARPVELRNVHFFVKPPTDKDPQVHQVKADVYGEIEIQFKTVT